MNEGKTAVFKKGSLLSSSSVAEHTTVMARVVVWKCVYESKILNPPNHDNENRKSEFSRKPLVNLTWRFQFSQLLARFLNFNQKWEKSPKEEVGTEAELTTFSTFAMVSAY